MLDTSVWVSAFRNEDADVTARTRDMLTKDVVLTCGPILLEIRRGLKRRERARLVPLLDALRRVNFHEADWDEAGDLDAKLRQRGITIPPMDILIARLCLRENLPLWTLDTHFESVPGLKLFVA